MSWKAYSSLALVAVALTAIGLAIDPESLTENLLAELAGIAVGVIVALALVERLQTRRQAEEWGRVRTATLRGLANQLEDLALEFYLVGTAPRDPSIDFLRDTVGSDYERATRAMEGLAETYREEEAAASRPESGGEPRASSRELYSAVSEYFHTIRDVLTPRVISVARDARLVELLAALESRERDWKVALYNIEEWGAPYEIGWEASANVLEAATEVYRHAAEGMAASAQP